MVGVIRGIVAGMLRRRARICCWRAGFRTASVSATGNGRTSLVRAFHFVLPRIYNTLTAYRASNTFAVRRCGAMCRCPAGKPACSNLQCEVEAGECGGDRGFRAQDHLSHGPLAKTGGGSVGELFIGPAAFGPDCQRGALYPRT